MNSQKVLCSIVIPTHNRRDVLLQCLDAIAKQTRPLDDIEVIICDDGSSDGTAEAVSLWNGPFVPLILRNETAKGPGQARNLAFPKTRGEYILYLNDDAILTPHALDLHLSWHGRYMGKKLAVVGNFCLPPHYEKSLFGYLLNRSDLSFRFPKMQSQSLYGFHANYSCNLSFPREAHLEVGLFDEDFPVGAEDLELGYRMQLAGYQTLYIKNSLAFHEHKLDVAGFCRAQPGRGAGGVVNFTKHPELRCHYERITMKDVERLKRDLPALAPAVKKIISLMERLETQYTLVPAEMDEKLGQIAESKDAVLFPRQPLDMRVNQMMWQRGREEIREYAGKLITILHAFAEKDDEAFPELLDAVCACGYFLKWYYDTEAVANSPWIERFIAAKEAYYQSVTASISITQEDSLQTAVAKAFQAASGHAAKHDGIQEESLLDLAGVLREKSSPMAARIFLSKLASVLPEDTVKAQLAQPNFFSDCWPHFGQREITLPDASGKAPLFSVITPSYNQAAFIEDTIHSVLGQGVASYEHIVMDGGSTDGTVDILKKYPHLIWKSEKDRGQSDALNKAIALAKGEIIAWINSDDFYMPGAFQAVAEYFKSHPDEDILLGDALWLWENSGRAVLHSGREVGFEEYLRYWNDGIPTAQPAMFFRRSLIAEKPFDEENHYAMDYELWLRITQAGAKVRYLQGKALAICRHHGASKAGADEDWSIFFPGYQRAFSQYKEKSQKLPKSEKDQPLLSVVFLMAKGDEKREGERILADMRLAGAGKLHDMEIVLFTDSEEAFDFTDIPVTVRIVRQEHIDEEMVKKLAPDVMRGHFSVYFPQGEFLHWKWFVGALNALIDAPEKSRAVCFETIQGEYRYMYRTASLKQSAV